MVLPEVAGKCRACQEETSKKFQIPIYSQENLKDIFHDVTSIMVSRGDKLPGFLCSKCHSRLLEAHQFRQMCVLSALKFHRTLVKKNLIPKDIPERRTGKYKRKKKKKVKQEKRIRAELSDIQDVVHPTEYVNVELEEKPPELFVIKQEQEDADEMETIPDNPYENQDQESDEEAQDEETISVKINPVPEEIPANRTCYICKKTFDVPAAMVSHLSRVHKKEEFTECLICEKNQLSNAKLEEHLRDVHEITAEEPICKVCKKPYQHQVSLQLHMNLKHNKDKPYKSTRYHICEVCGKIFKDKPHLRLHSYIHSGLRPFSCPHCPKTYKTRSHLKEHVLRHKGILNFVCKICGLKKESEGKLNVHMNIHTKEKTYTCQYCNKVFNTPANMKRHVNLVHLGIRAYSCSTCGRAFGKQETLKHHEMIHTGEKPEVCKVCGKAFIQRVALKKHLQTHEKNK